MKRALIAAALFAGLHASTYANCNAHTNINAGVDREVIHQYGCAPDVTSVPTTSENVLIALSGIVLALGLFATKRRQGLAGQREGAEA